MEHLALGRLLSAATRLVIERMHADLAGAGHPGLRPAYGYAVYAISRGDVTTSRLGFELGMTKQGAAKLVATLCELGYVDRHAHERDGRAQILALTPRGEDLLRASAQAQDRIERDLAQLVGSKEMRDLRAALERAVELGSDEDRVALRPIW